ncbi:MAG: hypothetical protein IPO92_10365 [Saprospiraceae bacterium]|nr:hypothetical protein [Saprospiraceae bacterium]
MEAICSVRIAKDDEKLLKNFELSDASKPEDVEISPTMSVELIDPSGGKVFGIRMVSPLQVQKITEHTFTEWDFAITPLSAGKHLIYLYAHFIEDFDGEETRRTISFKRSIEITTEKVEELHEWQPTNIIISQK